jgi:hypothetical protein
VPLTPDDKRNETIKFSANWANMLANTIMSVGVFVPIFNLLYGILPNTAHPALVYGSTPVCFGAGCGIHLARKWLLRGLR